MIIYTALLVWVIACVPLESVSLKMGKYRIFSGKAFYLILTFIPIWLVMALRGPMVGSDTMNYTSLFVAAANSNSLLDVMSSSSTTGGMDVISYFVGMVSSEPQTYVIWTSTVVAIGFSIFIYRTSPIVWLSTLIFLTLNMFYNSLNAARQFVSISIMLNSFVFLYYDIYSKKGWGLFLLATWIHVVNIAFLPGIIGIILFRKCTSYTRLYAISSILTVGSILSFTVIAVLIASFFPHYAGYVNGSAGENLMESTGSGRVRILYLALLAIAVFYYLATKLQELKLEYKFFDVCIPGIILGTVLGIIGATNPLMNRIIWPYMGLFLAFIPAFVCKLNKMPRFVFLMLMVLALIGYYFYVPSHYPNLLPYYTWL